MRRNGDLAACLGGDDPFRYSLNAHTIVFTLQHGLSCVSLCAGRAVNCPASGMKVGVLEWSQYIYEAV